MTILRVMSYFMYADVVGVIKDIQLIPIARESVSDAWLPEGDFLFKK